MRLVGRSLAALALITSVLACSYDYAGASRCSNGQRDGDETDTDCGGSCVADRDGGTEGRCGYAKRCAVSSDCDDQATCEVGRCTPRTLTALWKKLEPSNAPAPRFGARFTRNSDARELVLFGGFHTAGGSSASLGDMWTFKGDKWQNRGTIPAGAREYHAQAYDADLGETVIAGGETEVAGVGFSGRDDVWTTSKELPPKLPGKRSKAAMVHAGHQLILFGGVGPQDQTVSNATALLIRPNVAASAWQAQTTQAAPPARFWHAMVHDEARDEIMMFGGCIAYQDCEQGTAILAPTSLEWQSRDIDGDPGPRSGPAMAYDPGRERTVLFGGRYGGDGTPNRFGDTWEWNGAEWFRLSAVGDFGPPPTFQAAFGYDELTRRMILLLGGGDKGYDPLPNETWTYTVLGWPCGGAQDCGEGAYCADGLCCNDPCEDGACDTRMQPGICVR